MENVTNEMIVDCLRFIQRAGGEVSRYLFDQYVTGHIHVKESFNVLPTMLLDDGLIEIHRAEGKTSITITPLGIERLTIV